MFGLLRRLRKNKDGNVTITFALSVPILLLVSAFAINYDLATTVRSRLDDAADAAALAALTPAMLQQSDSVAAAAAAAMFTARSNSITSLTPNTASATVAITYPGNNPLLRTVTVTYTAQLNTIFASVMGSKMGLGGTATAEASIPPNIDFYLLLDNSPSMSLPASTAGITQMQSLTAIQDGGAGCAFACHQASTNNGDTEGNPCSDGSQPTLPGGYCALTNSRGKAITQIDNFTLARNNGITLRLDELSSGVSQLMTTASGYSTSGIFSTPPKYRFAAYEMDTSWNVPLLANNQLMALTSSFITGWQTASANFGVMEMYANSVGCANSSCTLGVAFNDVATNYDVAMSSMNTTMPTPGKGTNQPGDKPEEVLFFVTDGVEDEQNIIRLIQPINAGSSTNYCTMIKNRGIKIAVLYTAYLPVPANAFYVDNVAPIQANLGPALQACASPNLFYQAAIGADLGTALATMFQAVVQSAALSN